MEEDVVLAFVSPAKTGGTAYGKKKEPESNCKEDQKNGNYTDSEQEVQRYGVPDAVFGS